MGQDGPCYSTIAEGKIKLKPLEVYHRKVGSSLSVEMSVKHRAVMLLVSSRLRVLSRYDEEDMDGLKRKGEK